MTWTTYRNRGEILRSVIHTADARRDGELPFDVDGASEVFTSDADLLGALVLRWHTRLAGQIEQEILRDPMRLDVAVVVAWRAVADEFPGIRAIIDRHRERAAAGELDADSTDLLAASAVKEHILLAMMAGQASATDDAATVAVGARLATKARSGWQPQPLAHDDAERPSLLGRLKAALAA